MNPIILLGGGVIVLLLLIIGVVVSITSERSLVEERLGRFLEDEKPEPEGEGGGSIITEWLNRRVARSSAGDRIARELARADLKFKVA
jgi:tight adherence protein B